MSISSQPLPPQDHLVEALDYDPETGELRWKHRPQSHFRDLHSWSAWNGRFAGTEAGRINKTRAGKARLEITIDWVRYPAGRLAWKIQTGEDPQNEIDHIDGDSLNNRWRICAMQLVNRINLTLNQKLTVRDTQE